MATYWKPLSFDTLQQKARILQQIRAFFLQHSLLEVSTPVLSPYGTTDPTIESLTLQQNNQTYYLQTSPEFFMKRLLAAGSGSIYQIAHAYRREEQGIHHLCEFTLIEWYVLEWNYVQLMKQVEQLIGALVGEPLDIPVYTYQSVFQAFVGFCPFSVSTSALKQKVPKNLNDLKRDALLDYFVSIEILPKLKTKGWFFIKDYPASQASLAKLNDDNPHFAERFELFYNGVELANGFTELQNAQEQVQRFKRDNEQRVEAGLATVPIDVDLIQALGAGLPKCAGVALGLERLMMVLLDIKNIQQVGLN